VGVRGGAVETRRGEGFGSGRAALAGPAELITFRVPASLCDGRPVLDSAAHGRWGGPDGA